MQERLLISEETFKEAQKVLMDKFEYRCKTKGKHSFASRHEAFGVITEEYDELADAIRQDDSPNEFYNEMIDIAVACLFGVASILEETNQYLQKRKSNE